MPDVRLIDANALLKRIAHHTVHDSLKRITFEAANTYEQVKGDMFALVQKAPVVDAVEVVHGRWILERIYRKCSLCEWIFCIRDEEGDLQKFNYCPNCGMPMDGGAEC